MKNRISIIYTMILMLLVLAANESVYAQLSTQGTWATTTISKNVEVTLTGDLYLGGTISVANGGTLTINNTSNTPFTITSKGSQFSVSSGGVLKIKGNAKGRIILDGGAEYVLDKENMTLTAGTAKQISYAISNSGRLELDYVTIQNVNDSGENGGAINNNATTGVKTNGTYLTNCIIQKCRSLLGSALMITGSAPVYITDSEITGCFTGGGTQDNSGGAIRTYGSTSSSLHLTRVKFSYNRAPRNTNYNTSIKTDGNGAAIFWNARGAKTSECVIENCEFAYNVSDDNGGAIKSQGTLRFTGKTTTFHHNKAPVGAALYIEGYTGGAGVAGTHLIEYDLNSSVEFYENTAPNYTYKNTIYPGKGAGIHFYFGKEMSLEKGSTIKVNLNGAKIHDNITGNSSEALGMGGGIYFENTAAAGKYTFEINMNYGEVKNNKSYGQGGGLYVYSGNINSTNIDNKPLEISNNKSMEGAGLYVQNGNLNLANGSIASNETIGNGNGGGIFINNGDFTINAGSVSNNKTTAGNGGGVYIVGSNGKGNFTMSGGSIFSNTSSLDGGGIYINGGQFIQDSGSIEKNISNANGGGVCIVNGGTFTMNGGSITENGKSNSVTSTAHGGGVYLNGGNFILTNGEISGNAANGNGGGVFLTGDNCTYTLQKGEIQNNSASYGGGVYLEKGLFILGNANNISDGNISENSAVKGGGVYIGSTENQPRASSAANDTETHSEGFVMYGGEITSNTTTDDGGGIYLKGGDFTQYNGLIQTNVSATNGGGIYLDGGTFNLMDGTVQENISSTSGGGVYLSGGNFTMNDGTISSNLSTVQGGGVCIVGGGNFTMNNGIITLNGKEQSGNIKTEKGGGVYLENGTFTLGTTGNAENGTIYNNGASNGGGVYLNGGEFIQNNGSVNSNISDYFGGGVCIVGGSFTMNNGLINGNGKNNAGTAVTDEGGGVYLDGGALYVKQGKILSNASTDYGGGLYILNGEVEMGAGYIESNTCGLYGGGVYVFNDNVDDSYLQVSFSGGILQGNKAMYGGGICVDGKINLTIGNVQIVGNTATNGGGVCLMNNANMNFEAGQIINNKAEKPDNETVYQGVTACKQGIDAVSGMGGGVYLDSDTKLVFNAEELGLFGNTADNGANELFANGDGTYVNVPDVTHMKLDGFTGAGNLKWIEDYITDDAGYLNGTNLLGYTNETPDKTILRYKDMISQNMQNIPHLTGGIPENENDMRPYKYICFALGYEVIYITITKTGLKEGESAIFTIFKDGVEPVRLILTGKGNGAAVSKKIALTAGVWTVAETPWSWTYEPSAPSITQDIADDNKRNFVFGNTKKESLPMNHEHVIYKTMGGNNKTAN